MTNCNGCPPKEPITLPIASSLNSIKLATYSTLLTESVDDKEVPVVETQIHSWTVETKSISTRKGAD